MVELAKRSDVDAAFGTDEGKEKDGVEFRFGKIVTKVARAGGSNTEFAKLWEELTRPYKRMMEAGVELPEDVAKDVAFSAFATLVTGWNLADDAGQPVPPTADNVVKEFQRNNEYFREVMGQSQKLANYRKMVLEEEAKN